MSYSLTTITISILLSIFIHSYIINKVHLFEKINKLNTNKKVYNNIITKKVQHYSLKNIDEHKIIDFRYYNQ